MSIGSHDVTDESIPSAASNRRLSFGEFLLSLFVVLAAILLGAAAGIWLAERDWSERRAEIASSQASPQPSNQPLSPDSDHGETGMLPPVIPESKAAIREQPANIITLGLPSIRAIHHSKRQDFTEIAIELRAAVLLRAAQLHDPERVYFDLAESGRRHSPKGRLNARREVALDDPRVSGVRIVRWESGAVRIVVDLKDSCEYSYRLSPEPSSRIIVELRASPRSALASQNPAHEGTTNSSAALATNPR